MDKKIVVVDCETGGLNPQKNSLLSLAVGIFQGTEHISFKEWNIKPEGALYHVSPYAMDVNKIDLVKHYANSTPLQIAVEEYRAFVKGLSGIFVGHNLIFDASFLDANGFDAQSGIMRNHIDTKALALHLMNTGKIPDGSTSLQNLLKLFKIDPGTAHTAQDDVMSTYKLYLALSKF